MRHEPARSTGWILCVFVLLAGCGGGSDGSDPPRPPPGPLPGAEPPSAPAACNGANLSTLSTLVYVRSDGADADGCGATTASACASIQKGIDSCAPAGCGVVVRHGVYEVAAPIVLKDGINVYGSCLFDGEAGRTYRSIVNGPADKPAVSAASIVSATAFQGFVVRAANALQPGGASVAMTVADSSGLSLNQVRLVAGNGAPGTKGADAGTVGAGVGGSGTSGGQSCPATSSPYRGGNGGTNSITVANCFFDCDCYESHTDATGGAGPGGGPNPGGPGASIGRTGIACTGRGSGKAADDPGDGGGGGNGDPGACAPQAGTANGSLPGTLGTSAGWSAGTGGRGTGGGVGAGGGGGQAGGNASWTDGSAYNGASGGGGGGGGCGGLPGNGGQQGGASIALAVAGTLGQADARSVMIAARGGDGGPGGSGGAGGAGGGGTASGGGRSTTIGSYGTSVPGNGGAGGDGGAGGAGSGGAGGNGGPSIGIALAAGAIAPAFDAAYAGTPGNGGASGGGGVGGLATCTAPGGQGGFASLAATTFDYGAFDWSAVMGADQTLANNQALTGPSTQLVMQSDGNLCLYRLSDHGFLWCSFALNGGSQSRLLMQGDGNLCVVAGRAGGESVNVWCSGSDGHPGAYLALDSAGRVAVLQGATVVWSAP